MKNEDKKDSYQQSETDSIKSVRVNEHKNDLSKSKSNGDYNHEDAGGTRLGHKKDQGKSFDQELKKQ